jgi:hypothetical protein
MSEVLNIIKTNVNFHVFRTLEENNVINCLHVHTFFQLIQYINPTKPFNTLD